MRFRGTSEGGGVRMTSPGSSGLSLLFCALDLAPGLGERLKAEIAQQRRQAGLLDLLGRLVQREPTRLPLAFLPVRVEPLLVMQYVDIDPDEVKMRLPAFEIVEASDRLLFRPTDDARLLLGFLRGRRPVLLA